MHFTRSETFPPEGPASVVTTQTISTTKPVRPQPEGLRARYTPLGVPSPKPTINAPVSAKNKAVAKAAEQDAAVASTPKASKKKRKHRDDDGEDGPAATVSTPVQKDAAATGNKKNTPAEKSAKKQKTGDKAPPRKETPVLPPVPGSRSNSISIASASSSSQPAPWSRTSLSPGVALPATQIPTAKRTPVPIPTLPSYSSAGASGQSSPSEAPKDGKKAKKTKAGKKGSKKVDKETLEAASQTAPAKHTPILPPRFDDRGRPLR